MTTDSGRLWPVMACVPRSRPFTTDDDRSTTGRRPIDNPSPAGRPTTDCRGLYPLVIDRSSIRRRGPSSAICRHHLSSADAGRTGTRELAQWSPRNIPTRVVRTLRNGRATLGFGRKMLHPATRKASGGPGPRSCISSAVTYDSAPSESGTPAATADAHNVAGKPARRQGLCNPPRAWLTGSVQWTLQGLAATTRWFSATTRCPRCGLRALPT